MLFIMFMMEFNNCFFFKLMCGKSLLNARSVLYCLCLSNRWSYLQHWQYLHHKHFFLIKYPWLQYCYYYQLLFLEKKTVASCVPKLKPHAIILRAATNLFTSNIFYSNTPDYSIVITASEYFWGKKLSCHIHQNWDHLEFY